MNQGLFPWPRSPFPWHRPRSGHLDGLTIKTAGCKASGMWHTIFIVLALIAVPVIVFPYGIPCGWLLGPTPKPCSAQAFNFKLRHYPRRIAARPEITGCRLEP